MNLEEINKIVVFIFTVSNLAALGLEMKPADAVKTLKNPVFIILTVVWGWVIGPLLGLVIVKLLPLSASHAAGLILISLAPMTPAYPVMVGKARGDMSAAGAFTIIAMFGTVLFLPLMVPWLIKGMSVSIVALAKPLLIFILLPLLIGLSIRIYAAHFADKILPFIKKTGGLFLLLCAALTTWIYWPEMLATLGSFAIGALLLFLIILTVLSYKFGFGLNQGQRTAMSLGMCTRNISAAFVAYFGITNPDPGVLVIIVLLIPITIIVGFAAAGVFARQVAAG
ncbi:MAG: bile acid:sodium symporter [Bacteroidota bacterium]|nr:MAG: bile acid:sodium symporter [Bacteroidota bacterium]